MIRVSDLTFTYPGGSAPAVRELQFEVEDGEIFGFLGPSGAGKSTTQNILTGLLGGFAGSVEAFAKAGPSGAGPTNRTAVPKLSPEASTDVDGGRGPGAGWPPSMNCWLSSPPKACTTP